MKVIKENDPTPFFGVSPFCQLFFFFNSDNLSYFWNGLGPMEFTQKFGHFVIHPYAKCSKMAILFTL